MRPIPAIHTLPTTRASIAVDQESGAGRTVPPRTMEIDMPFVLLSFSARTSCALLASLSTILLLGGALAPLALA